MSEPIVDPAASTEPAPDEFKPITTQDDLNKVLNERLQRERAKYADYKDVKSKAARLDELEEANKSELQKFTDRASAAEAERDSARIEMLRFKVAAKHGINEDDADLFLTGKDEDTLMKQAARLADRESERKKQGNHVPREGNNPASNGSDELDTARALFGG